MSVKLTAEGRPPQQPAKPSMRGHLREYGMILSLALIVIFFEKMTNGTLLLPLNLTNLSALLWRLDMLGCDVTDRWRALLPLWDGHADGNCLVFTDMHAAMAAVEPSGSSDVNFVRLMLPHHQAAIEMAKTQLLYGKDPQMRRLAQEIITDQQSEIQLMQLWLKQHGPSSPQEKPAAARSGAEER